MNGEAVVKAVVGLRRYGKSTHVTRLTAGAPRVLFFDSLNDDYNEGVVCRDLAVLEKFWRRTYRGRFRITYKPVDPLTHLPRICELAYACGDMILVVDEVQLFFRGNWCSPEFTKIITAGGHPGVELIGVTQAPKRLGELLRSQAHEWHIFALREDDHIDYVKKRCSGIDPAQIRALQKYQYLHYVDGEDCYWRCIDDLTTGQTRKEEIAYATEAPRCDPAVGQHADAR